jgi:hypothetical protein
VRAGQGDETGLVSGHQQHQRYFEHVFAEHKDRMGLLIRTIGIARATVKIGLTNLVYNIKRLPFLHRVRMIDNRHHQRLLL